MKVTKITAIAIILLLVTSFAFAQKTVPNIGKKREVIKQYRTLELLKVLDLSNEESQMALPILKEIDNNRETYYFQRQQTIDKIEFALSHNASDTKLSELNNKLMKSEVVFEKERAKLYMKLRSTLTEEQFAKFIVFNRSFGKRLQKRLQEIHEKRPNRR